MSKSEGDAHRVRSGLGASTASGVRKVVAARATAATRTGASASRTGSSEGGSQPHDQGGESPARLEGSLGVSDAPPTSPPLSLLQAAANRCLQEAKEQLEASGNIKTTIKEAVIDNLFRLYQFVLKLSDSRRTLIEQLQDQKIKHVEEVNALREAHIQQLTELVRDQKGLDCSTQVETVRRDVEALRKIVEYDVVRPLLDPKKPTVSDAKDYKGLLAEMAKMSKELEVMRTEIKAHREELRSGTGGAPAGTLEQVARDVRALKQEHRSYADALRVTAAPSVPSAQHTIIVASRDPRHTADDVLKQVEAAADARKEGIRVDRFRKARDGKVIIGCTSADDAKTLSGKLKNSELTVEEAKPRNPLVEIRNVLTVNTDTDIIESILKQNPHITASLVMAEESVRVRFRRAARNPLEAHLVLEVSPRLWRKMTEAGKLYIGMQRRDVVDRSPLVQCSACLAYGHNRRQCSEEGFTCAYCAEKHERGKCEIRQRFESPRCINCAGERGGRGDGGAHTAFSDECPVRRRCDAIARSRVAYC